MSADEHEKVYSWILANQRDWNFRAKATLGQPFRRATLMKRLADAGPDILPLPRKR
jgi:hypothetical protein